MKKILILTISAFAILSIIGCRDAATCDKCGCDVGCCASGVCNVEGCDCGCSQ